MQAFDKVCHKGLLDKLRLRFPSGMYLLLHSYITDMHFQVRYENTVIYPIWASVPQGSVLDPTLYLIHTTDLPITESVEMIAIFADNTILLPSNADAKKEPTSLQTKTNL